MRARWLILVSILVPTVAILWPVSSQATRYWVAPSGSDANACASIDGESDPGVYRATPNGGRACLASGDTLTIKAGTYTGTNAYVDTIPAGLSVDQPTIIEGEPSDATGCALSGNCSTILTPTSLPSRIQSSYVIVRKLKIDHVNLKNRFPLEVTGTPLTNILVEDVELTGTRTTAGNASASGTLSTPGVAFLTYRRVWIHYVGIPESLAHHGMYLQGDDHVIEDSLIEDSGNAGIQCQTTHTTSDGRPDRCTIRRNVIRNHPASAVIIEGLDSAVIDNILTGNGGSGVLIGFAGGDRTHVYNNVITGNGGAGVRFGHSGTTNNAEAKNNILTGNGGGEIENLAGTGNVYTHNACTSAETCTTANKLTIASVSSITVSSADYRLKPGSAAIDAGTTVTGRACNGACDIGAFESIPTPAASITANTLSLTFPMNRDTPIQVPSGTGLSVSCTANPTACPASPSISSATRRSGADTIVDVTIAGITGNACESGQDWKITYDATAGAWTSYHGVGVAAGYQQKNDSFTNVLAANACTGSGPPTSPGTPYIEYAMDEGIGATLVNTGSAGSGKNGTLANGATWGTGHTGSGATVSGGAQQVQIPYGVTGGAIDPTTQSMTWVVAVNIPSGTTSATRYDIGTGIGANQRAYVGAYQGTWRVATQSTSLTASIASNLSVSEGWNHLCVNWNAATDTATLYKDGTAGTGGATRAYTSFSLPTDLMLAIAGSGFPSSAPGTYDDLKIFTTLEDCAALYAAWNAPPPATTFSFSQLAVQPQAVYLPSLGGSPTNFGTLRTNQEVVAGGAVAWVFQINCDNVADCDASAFRLAYKKNGTGSWQQVPDMETADGIWMWGSDTNPYLNSGALTTRLTGSCAVTNGVTLLTSAQVPSVDLPQDGCTVLRFLVKVGTTAGDYFDLRLEREGGVALTGTVASARVTVINPSASAGF